MKVILLQNVHKVGKIDDIKEVSDGYARNYLFVKNLAVSASGLAMEQMIAKQNKKKRDEEKDLIRQQKMASKLDGLDLVIREKVSSSGSLYAAIGQSRIVIELQKMGFILDKKQIVLSTIKTVGEYSVKIQFDHGLEAETRIIVLAK